ncbi:MAG: dimethylsulfonioproprionate lyase family protein [Arenibacterium sp.]
MTLKTLFQDLANALDGSLPIEVQGREALLAASPPDEAPTASSPLSAEFLTVLTGKDASPLCAKIATTSLPWASPKTSEDPRYRQLGHTKTYVELIGPGGIVRDETIRLGLYGIRSNVEYGIRTHPAEELFVMLAGEADWKRGPLPYVTHRAGDRSHHPSMMPHATRTQNSAFMSVYIWIGDLSDDGYVYHGLPTA